MLPYAKSPVIKGDTVILGGYPAPSRHAGRASARLEAQTAQLQALEDHLWL